ncbi:oligosaccharide flippase family protein [Gemella morbillorum]
MSSKKYSYLAQNTLLLTLSSFGSNFLAFFLGPLYTNVLTTSDYGTADIITTSVTLLIYIFTLNIGNAVLRFCLDDNYKPDKVFKFALKVILVGGGILSVVILICWKFQILQWANYCYIFLILLFLCEAIESMLYQFLRGINKVRIMALASLLSTFAKLISNILLLLVFKCGIIGYLVSMAIGPGIAILFSVVCAKKSIKATEKNSKIEKELHHEMIIYSVPTAISQLGWWINNSIDRYFVLLMKGAALNGIYAVSYKIPSIMAMLCNIFCQAWGISAIVEFDPEDSDGFYGKTYELFSGFLSLSCAGLILINIPISRILFAKEFFEGWKYSSLLVLGMALSGQASFFSGIFEAVKKNKVVATSTLISAFVNVMLNTVLIPKYGAMGAAIATTISFYVVWIIRLFFARKHVHFKVNLIRAHGVYSLLIIQIIFEHMKSHLYLGQIIVIVLIILLYTKELQQIIQRGKIIIINRFAR